MGRKRSATGWSRTVPRAGAASSWSTTCRCPRSWWAAASPPGLFRLYAGEPRLLGVSLQLRLHELLEVRRRIGDRLDADVVEPRAHFLVLHRGAHFAPELVDDVRGRVGRREHAEPSAVVPVLRQPGFRRGRNLRERGVALLAGPGEDAHPAALEVRHERRRRREHNLYFALRHCRGGGPAALVGDVRHLDAG